MYDKLVQTRFVRLFSGERVQTAFKLAYLWLALLSFNSFFANTVVLSCCSYALALFGAPIVAARIIDFKAYKNMPLIGLMCLFLLSFIISAVGTAEYGIIQNIQGFAWMTFEFFVLFAHSARESAEHVCGELEKVAKSVCWYTLVCSCLGLIMGVVGYADSVVVSEGAVNYFGVYQERLWGVYSDPNIGGVLCVISVLFAVWLRARGRMGLIFLAFNVAFQMGYIAMSGSRGSMLCAAVSSFVVIGLLCWKKSFGGTFLKKVFFLIGGGVMGGVTAVACVALIGLALQSCSIFVQAGIHERLEASIAVSCALDDANFAGGERDASSWVGGDVIAVSSEAGDTQYVSDFHDGAPDPASRFVAEGDLNTFSAGRLSIWRSALDVFCSSPLIGVSHRNILAYAKEKLPDTYIALAEYTTMHNILLDVLVSQGVLGFLLFSVILISGLKRMSIVFVGREGSASADDWGIVLAGVLAAVCVAALFYTEMLYINSPASVVFWSTSGALCAISLDRHCA